MYGDWGHGSIFLLLGIVLCFSEKKLRANPSLEGLLISRHFILMMGFFSVYMGLVYNEFFSVAQDFFGTCYDLSSFSFVNPKHSRVLPKDSLHPTCVYAFGLDPMWRISESNTLVFQNNIKQKLAILIAYAHLNFGIVLQALNCIYFGNYKKLIFEVFTGFVIFFGLIGFMVVLIYAKWWYPVYAYDAPPAETDPPTLNISTSPAIIVILINNIMGLVNLSDPNPEYYQFFNG